MAHRWTDEEKEFLRQNVEGTPIHKLTEMFNEHFETNMKYGQVRGTVKRMKLRCGVATQFKKGTSHGTKVYLFTMKNVNEHNLKKAINLLTIYQSVLNV
ncbi:hypothetical protein D0420_05500 [Staphylococcus saprophyticus]|uniref:hypothetical protein n=1 Tax=Staphylococcus saprophyticus TaxID=29385 RepID=UPI001932AD41|nr:hypothetical protein [Staphylococcus saprophyticus]MBM0844795.1 hypothetical protein [Staphylococcus saprophyticus]